jgi:hypothetical protein
MLVGMGIPIMGLLAAFAFDLGVVAWVLYRRGKKNHARQ